MTEQKYPILNNIDTPADLRLLPEESLPQLCDELRKYILEIVAQHPGHLGSSLGAVELTVALHYVFDTPHDRLVWDVGHQAYGHKILTGRRDRFPSLRQWGGLAGFPSTSESEYDTFTAGHASNSISAALGMAVATKRQGIARKVVAVIGDGSMTGGLAFEGLNNASSFPNDLLIVLNDNNMSIDKNVGGLNRYMVDILTSKTYNALRYDLYKTMQRMNLITESKRRGLIRFNNSFKALISQQSNLFEGFSIRYFGPIDGNDVLRTVQILRDIKEMKGPKILHLKTQKGKGYAPAEADATVWHAPGKFDINTGIRESKSEISSPSLYQDVFGHTLVEMAAEDSRIVGVTPAMPTGCSLTYMQQAYPHRTYDVGIAEGHAVTFSAGLSREGMIPFCNIYSSFMQRAYDQLIHDVAISRQHVVFCLDRAGLVGEDGATHQGAFDLAYLCTIPNMVVSSPLDEHQLRNLMFTAYKGQNGPMAIRYPRGKGVLFDWRNTPQILPIGKGREMVEGKDLAFLSIGPIGNIIRSVVNRLREEDGIQAAWYDLIYAKPLDTELILNVSNRFSHVITVEEGTLCGGVGAQIASLLLENGRNPKLKILGLPDEFIEHGTQAQQRAYCALDAESIYNISVEFLSR
ncbi:1-deoxy-D-xylulose-5-phosphate synthase [Porphyromonas crevioricanis]|uniref:1-deoxy-D-xylulose-5-phosphate synthase n=2 Tax=Porphyromonas crevioricanis TaxID=393921 RepID=A0A0A2G2A7_9PORP|nr:1-deoxy-D-xylulose-5-phosphate synthase [Porphyromonas crevioricanis]KGN88802.1 1-deoxy-D-xylulose-5-phosphate synthase [Porphyromonas crevioricanis]KGN96495.1 1-deoxy-D-xylulose-5-phosphate synthase [Porphyromonas crevioricanis]SJZ93386.1 1-deoxy-D-xylulose-5-phosphate synthase [Porphyromonas crevioricanis]SQH73577.1 1-deoxy-D-xylulose-5-phosphate synthase [Porphyromonas crevioricanis]GAD05523.1 1-deoxy-D-xylulose 5-phosphate synthase [Porphyromonas crevioricanis JCM 15906]